MAFINEKPSEEDKEKSGIRELKKKYLARDNQKFDNAYDSFIKWTIDRERDLVLIYGIYSS